jgi:hypothetical protein
MTAASVTLTHRRSDIHPPPFLFQVVSVQRTVERPMSVAVVPPVDHQPGD